MQWLGAHILQEHQPHRGFLLGNKRLVSVPARASPPASITLRYGRVRSQPAAIARNSAGDPLAWTHACSGAFRLNRLAAKTFEGKDVTGCNGPAFTSADVPQDLLPELSCALS